MKKLYVFLSFCLIHFITQAQAPQGIPYQSVIRNGSGALMINQAIHIRFSIHDSTMLGTIVYQESHTSTTTNLGMVTLSIGQGTPVIGTFSSINWGNGAKFMQVELDASGGNNYIDLGTQQLMSVPYALYAKTAGSISLPPGASHGQVLTFCDGNYVWTNGGICPANVATIDCSNSTNMGILNANSPANNVSSTITYTGGNGGAYSAQTVSSTDVSGLTATLAAGSLNNGNGSLTFVISGTPNGAGAASFSVNIGTQVCTLNRIVSSQPAYPAGSVFCNGAPTLVVDVVNPATGRIWMDRNLGATQAATSSTDTASYGDLYQWGRGSDGHQCRNSPSTTTLSSTDQPGHGNFNLTDGSPFDWRSPQNNNLWQGLNGINNPCPSGYRLPTETELETERSTWSSNNSAGAMASPLKWPAAGYRSYNNGLVAIGTGGYHWSSAVSNLASRVLNLNSGNAHVFTEVRVSGFSVRCIKEATAPVGSINTLDCNGATNSGTLTLGILATGVNSSISYSGGNGGIYPAQTIASTGVSGLTATIAAGIFANGNGTLTYTISGTPNSSGNASFVLNIGGQSCTLNDTILPPAQPAYPTGSVFCNGTPTLVVDVTNPATGKTWMDRNLGAMQAATSSTDANAYGDLYQWGRRSDGHQCRNSPTTTLLSSTDQPGHGNFITTGNYLYDWRSPQNTNLWQGANGVNNPCPSGYRLPSDAEFDAERLSWVSTNIVGAFTAPIKLLQAGSRNPISSYVDNGGSSSSGYYWCSAISGVSSRRLSVDNSNAYMSHDYRAYGYSVRCIKEATAPVGSINTLDCNGATNTGTLTSGILATGVNGSISYSGGNGGIYPAQTIASTGVTGLTATIAAGIFANGNGTLTYTISGTPNGSGTASFVLNIGGQSCTLNDTILPPAQPAYPAGSVFCNGTPTLVIDVTNPATGKIWMDRNLGATQAATSSTDTASYGDLYQWGRGSDGHQCRNSPTTTVLSSSAQPGHGNFIICPNMPFDWCSPQITNLWQGINGVNNPCPSGYRLPTEIELNLERLSWSSNNAAGAFASTLKLTVAGTHQFSDGNIYGAGDYGVYYSSNYINGGVLNPLGFSIEQNTAAQNQPGRGQGFSVRCVKD